MTYIGTPSAIFNYMKQIHFTNEEIEILSKDARVKYVDKYSLRFTLKFRQELYDAIYPNLTINNLRNILKEKGFSIKFYSKFLWDLVKKFKIRRPCGAANNEIYKPLSVLPIDKTYNSYLLTTGKFKKGRNGITPTNELIEEIYAVYPKISVEEYLKNIGLDTKRIGYQRIYNIQKELDEPTQKEITFNDEQILYLKNNPYIQKITKHQISFKNNFYQEAKLFNHMHINEILKIFEIDPNWINYSRKNNINYKIKSYMDHEIEPLNDNAELLIKIEKNKIKILSQMVDDILKHVKSNIANYSCLQRKDICNMIKSITKTAQSFYTTRELLNKVGISKSSYYSILNNDNYGSYEAKKNELDLLDKGKIDEVISANKYPKGNRMIFMLLNKANHHMSRNKIYRLCRKFDIKCNVRMHNKSRQSANELLNKNCKENLIKRKFRLCKPGDITLTDVSYLKCEFGTIYLSALKDACSGKIKLIISASNDLNLAINTLNLLPQNDGNKVKYFHSDQGCLYLNDGFQSKLKKLGYIQSMSKRGNCWDNSSQESFFGHMKDEVDFKKCNSIEEVEKEVKEYEYYYNYQRPQWTRKMMTPIEYEKYINSLNENEYQEYYDKELKKYNIMMEAAKNKAIMRSKDIGIEILV